MRSAQGWGGVLHTPPPPTCTCEGLCPSLYEPTRTRGNTPRLQQPPPLPTPSAPPAPAGLWLRAGRALSCGLRRRWQPSTGWRRTGRASLWRSCDGDMCVCVCAGGAEDWGGWGPRLRYGDRGNLCVCCVLGDGDFGMRRVGMQRTGWQWGRWGRAVDYGEAAGAGLGTRTRTRTRVGMLLAPHDVRTGC